MASVRMVAAAVVAAAVLVGGCATIPTVGEPMRVKGANGQAQPYVQPIPPVPDATWSEQDIVQGFMAASASFANGHAAARAFLAPQLRKSWQPGWAAAVVGAGSRVSLTRVRPNLEGGSTQFATVSLTGQQLATISYIGQYLDNPGSHFYTFKLAKFGDQWLITQLPQPSLLLLTQPDFEQVYQPRNLYVWSANRQVLVPEPVFAPQQDSYASVAGNLVKALLTNQAPASWLGAATTTDFPRGTYLISPVTIAGSTAVVNLGGAVASATPAQLRNMAAQLVTTLTSTSYTQAAISKSVVLEVNGRPRDIGGRQVQEPQAYRNLVPAFQAGSPLYYVGAGGAVSELSGTGPARAVPGPAGRGEIPFTSIAVSPTPQPQLAGTLTTRKGCVIYYGALAGDGLMRHRLLPDTSGAPCASVSWDSLGNIWAVAGQAIWVLAPGGRQPVAVPLPALPGDHPPSFRVLSLRVAPDGVRAAMLIQVQGGARQMVLAAISGSGTGMSLSTAVAVGAGVAGPAALTWYDADHLIVLTGSQLYEVPANGGGSVPIGPVPPGTRSVTAAGPGQIATSGNGEILTSSGPEQNQQPRVRGTSPAYPG